MVGGDEAVSIAGTTPPCPRCDRAICRQIRRRLQEGLHRSITESTHLLEEIRYLKGDFGNFAHFDAQASSSSASSCLSDLTVAI
ncbi:hypothetical protein Acr_04g0000530 [Actinidia rufa]|uniref:Uncharacterized protein n=1 Tax=Actinidia rufa TaxID=165716 RepID=A0A7J0EFS8_9ERIC|nr:hypothetical protein Acr_04g0000530 [Actinidia rufa]